MKFILLGEVSLLASWIKRGILIVMHMEIVIIVGHIRAMSDCLRPVKRRVSTIERLRWNVQMRNNGNEFRLTWLILIRFIVINSLDSV